ncbi:lycopene beta-cyclase CrtY [Novosphingobium flavum]|uniref:Lycopene beta-cyclase CrtY n=1 Tax=Novosphingobium flavum TaxID=1778672 RepID=A0A7X1FSA4_9SPHN|nr:lycopene beta-cyclase CrtY [Novosphingobium flavum]MBC2665919.1 lycopene beta-cyclase CrtY [Novosphingobium flavum]
MQQRDADIAVLGGGLSGGLIALALAKLRPQVRVVLIEQGAALGGNHVWSFFASDLSPEGAALVEPMVAARWPGYSVRFAGHERELASAYRSITSARLGAVLREALPPGAILTGAAVAEAGPDFVRLADGRKLAVGGVIDARGAASLPHLVGGWQKFLGQMVRTASPHGLARPMVMDASVAQIDGFRFVYSLPFAADRVFIEDTYYADGPALDLPALRGRIAAYAEAQGWAIAEIESEETGVLPVVAGGDWRAFRAASDHGVALAGVRAALFHPLTSYSLPFAVRFALEVAATADLGGAGLLALSRASAERHWREGRFYRMLSAMLFGAAAPDERHRVLERFYRLAPGLIERFYAGRSTMTDKARILTGRPPVPLGAALSALTGQAPLARLELAA